MILIATDEAGYGPKLGPLVVAATAWRLPDSCDREAGLRDAFRVLAEPVFSGTRRIVIDDSKSVFRPRSSGNSDQPGGGHSDYRVLETVTLAGCRWCGQCRDRVDLVNDLAPEDRQRIAETPWLAEFAAASVETGEAQAVEDCWRRGVCQLLAIRTRVITAAAFNDACRSGRNKSDLLSETTLSLVKSVLDRLQRREDEPVLVFCDRHGGRRYYAGPLQRSFEGTLVRVIGESKSESRYRVPYRGSEFSIRFTVKGDSFTPVAFSSLVAKYLRERAMESFNVYFSGLHPDASTLRPTAGYPVDADRFLTDIAPILRRHRIETDRLVRSR